MRMCKDHWDELKAALAARGLDRFIAKSGEEVVNRLTKEVSTPTESFEPLMGGHNAILSNCLRIAGLDIMRPNDDGTDRCPLCYLITNCQCGRGEECPFKTFVVKCADEQLEYAKHLKLVPEAS